MNAGHASKADQRSIAANETGPVDEDWLALHSEDVLDPALPIVDPHHHLMHHHGWRYVFDDFRADIDSGHNVLATVFVQCHAMCKIDGPEEFRPLGETEFVNGVAAMSASGLYGSARLCAGIVGFADLRLGASIRPVLEAHIRICGGRFRGIRHVTMWDDDSSFISPAYNMGPKCLGDPLFREGFACLAPLGLTFDACMFHPQLPDLIDLARAFPETRIVLNHVGLPVGVGGYAGRRDEVFAAWRATIRDLAIYPNVFVKLGGLGTRYLGFQFSERPRPPSSSELADLWRPYIETAIEAFGPERSMFESNFPADKISCSYLVIWNAFKRLSENCSSDVKSRLFKDTALDFYRLAIGA
jgi:predicted TIM-barrel fold metal-dependent hydrolase